MPERSEDQGSGDLALLLHDLRGPLNAALMHAQVLARLLDADPNATDIVATLRRQLERLAEMLPHAVELAGLQLGEVGPVDLRDVADRAIREHGLQGVRLAEGAWPRIRADQRLLAAAIAHLVRNALEASAQAGSRRPPEVSAEGPLGGRVTVRVRDWGPGLPTANPKALIRLLASSKPGHRGIGLVTAERIARLHGGALAFESTGDGAEVRLTVPAAGRERVGETELEARSGRPRP
jgi:signal transduction histidine kinase